MTAELEVKATEGLTSAEAQSRLARYGPNELVERGGKKPWQILLAQFTSKLVLILIVAAVISAVVGDFKDAIAILAIVILNAVLGFAQEYRAEQAMAALKKLATPSVRVRRDGQISDISARELVPGDIVLLEAGNLVPADGRLLEAANLRIQEAILTGESEPVEKQTAALAAGAAAAALGDRRNMAFMGTTVTYGRGALAVTASGMSTELGKVADMLQEVGGGQTPLQRRLDQLGRALAIAALAMVVIVFGLGVVIGEDWRLMFMTAISMAVAVVPEGLPAVVTIALALGAQRMLKRQALIRKLPAVETLGSVTVICSDKTGTLTENRMTVTILDLAGHRLDLTEEIRHREPIVVTADPSADITRKEPALALLLMAGTLANDATLQPDAAHQGQFRAVGDPTEGALVVAAARFGLWKDRLESMYPRVGEVPFDSERKRMSTLHRIVDCDAWVSDCADLGDAEHLVFTKGAVDGLLEVATGVWERGQVRPLDDEWRRRIAAANEELAGKGMRVLGVAFRPGRPEDLRGANASPDLERDLVLIGLTGMIDPPRPEVQQAVVTCKAAGIRAVMITGDHPLTARQIAHELGISSNGKILTGADLARMSVEDLEAVVEDVSVYARVSPEHKLNIVEALQKRGHVVAMTGDGVNDAPALKRADIGVAMGITGTDVSKEASEMVLLNDNFTTIVAAVEEGRAIYDNIRKFIRFSLAGNLGKVLVVLAGPLLGMPLPFAPFQILWMNLVTDGVLGLGMSVEPAESGAMKRPPHSPSEGVFARGLGVQITWLGLLIGIVTLAIGFLAWQAGVAAWQTMILTAVIFGQVMQAHVWRSSRDSVFRMNPFSNKPLLIASLVIVALQLVVVYAPAMHGIFETVALSAQEMAITLIVPLVVLIAGEIEKAIRRNRR
ncbi:MAG: cation-translocating P-type ATPase [Anaerolineae bacterium]|nr:cation-translocating P-type ATPase [Anaerolineae bacterium]